MSNILPKTAIFSTDEISQILGAEVARRFGLANGTYGTMMETSVTGVKLDWIRITMDAQGNAK